MEGFPGNKKGKRNSVKKSAPLEIQKAIRQDNLLTLRVAGTNGGRKSAEIRRKKADANEYWKEKSTLETEEDARKLHESTNEHILPIDPEAEAA